MACQEPRQSQPAAVLLAASQAWLVLLRAELSLRDRRLDLEQDLVQLHLKMGRAALEQPMHQQGALLVQSLPKMAQMLDWGMLLAPVLQAGQVQVCLPAKLLMAALTALVLHLAPAALQVMQAPLGARPQGSLPNL